LSAAGTSVQSCARTSQTPAFADEIVEATGQALDVSLAKTYLPKAQRDRVAQVEKQIISDLEAGAKAAGLQT
jgi:hypothetical protein